MLSYQEFATLAQATIPRFQHQWLNPEQEQAVSSPLHPPLYIVAGPGAGKTTVLVLRTLKFVFVDQVPPPAIIATTFTRKAAAELRSRILSWGYAILDQAIAQETDPARIQWLHGIDINLINTGTLDSLSEIFLADSRQPGEIVPATIEGFLAKSLLRRVGLFPQGRFRNADLEAFLHQMDPTHYLPYSMTEKSKNVLAIADRVRHDAIDIPAYAAHDPGHQVLGEAVSDYLQYLQQNHLADFGGLEHLLLEKLQHNGLGNVVGQLRAVLVDELQDTNYLQEQIYTEFCRQSGASLTVVGDDDQSIYRFRGATVEIFADFQNRISQALGPQWYPARVDLYRNYRSTSQIVNFCQQFVQIDPDYQPARAQGKVPLQAQATFANDPTRNLPVLGMFRTDVATLANDLSQLLWDVFRGNGRQITCGNAAFSIMASPGGDFGDSVLLAHSVRERKNGHDRLPILIRQNLNARNIRTFNPRGQSLGDITGVQRLLGLAMECIDPNSTIQNSIPSISQVDRARMTLWRQAALQFMATNPAPGGIAAFLQGWQTHTVGAGSGMQRWPREWPLLELIFTLTTWFPEFQHDPEGQVYLEAIARTIAEAGQMASYGSRILWGTGVHDRNSVQEAIRVVFESIANESVDVDEEIMPYIPRNYFPIMTIHQAKGLEFPLVIVDVGSDFRTNHHTQRRFRHPNTGDSIHNVERDVAAYCAIGSLRIQRSDLDRAWDDLRRLYFVSYSRPEIVLLLAGLTTQIRNPNPIPSISIGELSAGGRGLTFLPANQWTTTSPPTTVAMI